MSCAFSRDMLALHVEGDLPDTGAALADRHLAACDECRQFFEELRAGQSLLRQLRRETVSPADCVAMRREVMSIIERRQEGVGWALRLERILLLGLRRRSYAVAASILLGVLSASLLAHFGHPTHEPAHLATLLDGSDTLLRPEGHRDWVLVGSTSSARGAKVYIDPSSYRAYAKTGTFPEGTVMIWEAPADEPGTKTRPHASSLRLLASVKDSTRFDGGWGFFDLTGRDGAAAARARALPESTGCRACHRDGGEKDHVFTQYYPLLRAAHHPAREADPWQQAVLAYRG